MFVVALCQLRGSVEEEAAALAKDLGTTAYEERLAIASGTPAVVLLSSEQAPAAALLAKLRARGHGAVAFDAAAVVASNAMTAVRDFRFEPEGVVLPATGASLPFSDLLLILRAVHRHRTETTIEVKEKKFSAGKALLTGGLLLTSSKTREERSTSNATEQVLYLFRASGEAPWLLRERGTNYAGLGADLAASSAQSFLATIARLRSAAPHASYDDRLAAPGAVAGKALRAVTVRGGDQSSAAAVDLLAHATMLWIRRLAAGGA